MRFLAASAALLALSCAASAQTLKTADAVVSQFEDGAPLAGLKVVPGEVVFFRFAAVNFKSVGEGKVRLVGRAQVFDSRGTPISPRDEQALDTSLREEDKDFRPRFHFQFQLPSIAPPGTWRVRFDVTDLQSNQHAEGDATFLVDGHDIPAAQELTVRNLAFYRGQEDEAPLRIAAFRAGDAVWVRFDVTGYKYGDQNAIDVSYDVAVNAPDGKRLFTQESAAVERSQAFYPQPWVPGTFSLTLQPTMRMGSYTVTITAHDGIGRTNATAEAQFRVE